MYTAAGRLLLDRGLSVRRPPQRTNDIYCASGDGLGLRGGEWGVSRHAGARVIFDDILAREPKGTQEVVGELSRKAPC